VTETSPHKKSQLTLAQMVFVLSKINERAFATGGKVFSLVKRVTRL
jgi:hypothetical protein